MRVENLRLRQTIHTGACFISKRPVHRTPHNDQAAVERMRQGTQKGKEKTIVLALDLPNIEVNYLQLRLDTEMLASPLPRTSQSSYIAPRYPRT